jgi:signal transduction histidine kinase
MNLAFRMLLFALAFQVLGIGYGYAASPAFINGEAQSGELLNGYIEALEDKEGTLSIVDVVTKSGFQNTGEHTPNFKFTDSTYWLRFSITNETPNSLLILEIGYPLIDYVSLFWRDDSGRFREVSSGDMLPFSKRAREHRTLTFELNQPKGTTTEYYLSVKGSSSLQIPLRVYTDQAFAKISNDENMILGAYYGALIIMILFNLLLGFSLKDRAYFHYVGYLGGYLSVQMALNGNGHRFIFPNEPVLSNILLPASLFCAMGMATSFSKGFLDTETYAPRFDFVYKYLIRFAAVCFVLTFLAPYAIMIKLGVVSTLVVCLLFIVSGTIIFKRGYQPAKTYLIAWSTLIAGVVIYLFKTTGLLPSNLFTNYSILVGSAVEVTLLSLALADRIHVIQQERETALSAEAAAHYSLAESYEALNGELKRREVAEKALALELRARGHLVAEAAHRLNNPLNIALGGLSALEQLLGKHSVAINNLFQGLEAESNEDKIWIERMKVDLNTMEEASGDARLAAYRMGDFLEEFRTVGGLRGTQNHYTKVSSIFERSNARLIADLGSQVMEQINVKAEVEGVTVWSNDYVAGLLLSYSLRDLLNGYQGVVDVQIQEKEGSLHLTLKVAGPVEKVRGLKADLVDLSPTQLGEAVGGGSPLVEAVSHGEKGTGYRLVFNLKPPTTAEV